MGSGKGEIFKKNDWKQSITLILIIMLTLYTLVSYVNAMGAYRPSIVSQYAPPIFIPPPVTNLDPIADAGLDQDIFVNQTVYFDGSGSQDTDGIIVSYSWSFGDGESATSEIVSHKYTAEGVYEVNLTVTDDDEASDYDVITITVREPTVELISPLSPEDSANILEETQIEISLDIIINLNLTQAAKIVQALNNTSLMNIVETAINLDQTSNISLIIIEMEVGNATRLILDLNPAISAQILESMTKLNFTIRDLIIDTSISIDQNKTANILVLMKPQLLSKILIEIEDEFTIRVIFDLDAPSSAQTLESMAVLNTTKSALIIETIVTIDQGKTAVILELMETQALLEILIEISHLPSSPSTAATIIESLSIVKAIELSKAWISSADIQDLGIVWQFLSSETLHSIFGNLTISERSSIYPYLTTETVSMIQSGLLPLPDMTITSFTITQLGNRGYQLNGTIENQGNTESGTFITNLLIDDELVEQFQISVLSPGKSTMFSFEWKPTSRGAYTFEAIVDPANLIEENDEVNNAVAIAYGVELPDVTIVFISTPTKYVEAETYTLSVKVSNIGEEEATDFDVKIEGSGLIVTNGDVRWITVDMGSSAIDRLPPGSTETIDFSWIPEATGAYTLIAIADPLEQILEGVRENNVAELQVEVEEKPSNLIYILALAGIAVISFAIVQYRYPEKVSKIISKYI